MIARADSIFTEHNLITRTLRVRGLVQGVGFRPTVWRLANQFKLAGNVCNDGEGVLINIYGKYANINNFTQALITDCPPLARIDSVEQLACITKITDKNFQIINSKHGKVATGIVADAATCNDCLDELMTPSDRHYHYPFLNCTHCGPRFSITRKIPYDRANTSMSSFKLCGSCKDEYKNPADRRFHAQPTACASCGPEIWLCNKNGKIITSFNSIDNTVIKETARQIKQGAIIAIKGIGGIHLACDSNNKQAIEQLRERKNRPHKALALMANSLKQVRHYCRVSQFESEALTSPAAPIVILDALTTKLLPENIAPGQKQWGFMLPYSPLHHLLMAELDYPIVLTSGNLSDEPQCIENEDALKRLSSIADIFLLHNRPIENRIDDSVVRQMNDKMQVLRRARGYAPDHIPLPAGFTNHSPVLALGGELKSTFCLLKNGHAILSQHIGDLEDARTFDDYQKNISLYLDLYAHKPEILVTDNHPEYLSSKLGIEWSEKKKTALVQVQHHHAHIAACMIENNIDIDETSVIGVAFDGLGFGDNDTLWGGEFLLANYQSYKHLAQLKPVVMPGGSQAMREPWRNTWAQLNSVFGWDVYTNKYAQLELSQLLNNKPIKTLQQMINRGINSPLASSAGRLFDAVAAATGVAPQQCSYEGQAAMALEACIDKQTLKQVSPYHFKLDKQNQVYQLDPTPMWINLLNNLKAKTANNIISARFHRGLAQAIIDTSSLLASENKINRIVLSGGVFQNRTLFELVVTGLEKKDLQVLTHHRVPANDGGLSLGQAAIAVAREIKQKKLK